jgi:cyclohexyl-isocyanide hydratase
MTDTPTTTVGMLLFPRLTQLDLTGPFQVFAAMPDTKVHLVWKSTAPVSSDVGLVLTPTLSMDDCPPLDVLFVPGGNGVDNVMGDPETLDFLRTQAAGASWVTSVCTGSLVLGAAGLLDGYRAACHWAYRDLLARFGAIPTAERVVIDRNRATGGGVTAGIDFGLTIAAQLHGAQVAKELQLRMEYAPAPPFSCGNPEEADPHTLVTVLETLGPMRQRREASVEAAVAALRAGSPAVS